MLPVGHQLELPVRRDEGDGSVVLEPGESDTLVELDILQLHALTLPPPCGLEENLVIQSEPQLRHPGEVDPHLHDPHDLGPQHVPLSPGQEVDALDNVEEDFIFTVLDVLRPPGHRIGDCWGRFGSSLQLVSLLE